MSRHLQFNRMELAGSLGDFGTILPLALGMIIINGLDPLSLFFCVGVFYLFSGLYFRVTAPVEPMKVIGAYAVATGISASLLYASSALISFSLLLIGGTGAITFLGRYVPKPVIRGVQLSTGVLLVSQGVKLMLGTSKFQIMKKAAEPYLAVQSVGPIPVGILIGVVLAALTLLLLENRKFPAALVIALIGLATGFLLGTHEGLDQLTIGFNLPEFLPKGIPSVADFTGALVILVLPQIPMTLGNAVIANADLSHEYFGETAKRVTYPRLCISMAVANCLSFLLGGMPMCHGAGGLASRYRFGARTAGSNILSGIIFLGLAVLLGRSSLSVLYFLPMSVLGVLLVFAGSQLALTLLDMKTRKDLFIPLIIVGITLASNLAVGFVTGIALAYALKSERLSV
jgi:sulfate permease, SulP family